MSPTPTRWGICATGWISSKFSLDLLADPTTRGATDVVHCIQAVASRSTAKASAFIESIFAEAKVAGKDAVTAYGSYDELFQDENVDVVYIGSPHSHHYQNVLAALEAGKNVLCEKSLTVNAKQAKVLTEIARKKNVFFMEAVWLRFQPVSAKVEELVRSGIIGEVRSVKADLSVNWQEEKKDPSHRMVAPDLAGGALLDLGPYPWTWLALLLCPTPTASSTPVPSPKLVAAMTKTATGVDASTIAVIQFPQEDGRIVHGTLTASLDVQVTMGRVVVVQGTKGYLEVQWPTYRPRSISYSAWASAEDYGTTGSEPIESETISFEIRPGGIWGMSWEADEVARCLRDGKKESSRMPLRDTVLMMEVFDEIRRQGDLVYPEAIETIEKRALA